MKKVIVICGPTASGKTTLSIELAKLINCEIINADSRQIYKYFDIGTAKPSIEERQIVKHYFVDYVFPDQHYDAGIFGDESRKVVSEIFAKGKIPVIVGGSGLYIRSLIDGLFEGPPRNEEIREKLESKFKEVGVRGLMEELMQNDPETASKIDPFNKSRLIRALEVFYITGKPISQMHKEYQITVDFSSIIFGLNWEREIIYERVNKRTDEMIFNGLLEETCDILSRGYHKTLKSLNTVGYKECIQFLDGEINREKMIELIKQNTRHYVKRQYTWFNQDDRINWFEITNEEDFVLVVKNIYDKYFNEKEKTNVF